MEGFKSSTKMQCFKEGGQVKYKSRRSQSESVSADIAQDKKIVKKAFKMHDEQEHAGEHTDLSKLKKGGRSKKAVGTVRKYKTGGGVKKMAEGKVVVSAPYDTKYQDKSSGTWIPVQTKKAGGAIENAYGAKKTDKDIKDIANAKRQKPALLCGGKSVKKMQAGGVPASAPIVQQGAISNAERAALRNALPGGVGQGSINDIERQRMAARAKNALKYLGPQQQNEFVKQGGMNPAGVTGQKKGGKVKKECK